MAEMCGLVPGDIVLSVNGVSGLSNFQVVEMLRKGQGVFTLVVISGQQVSSQGASWTHMTQDWVSALGSTCIALLYLCCFVLHLRLPRRRSSNTTLHANTNPRDAAQHQSAPIVRADSQGKQ